MTRRWGAALSFLLLVMSTACAVPEGEISSGDFDGPWALAVQPGEIHESYVMSDGLTSVGLPDCAVPSDTETPVLNRDGTAIALVGCWSRKKSGEGKYEIVVIRDRAVRHIDASGQAAWIGKSAGLLVATKDTLTSVDTSESAKSRRVADFDADIQHLNVDTTGDRAVVVTGGNPVTRDHQVTLVGTEVWTVSIATGRREAVRTPPDTSRVLWGPDGQSLVAETDTRWTVLDGDSGQVLSRRPRPATKGEVTQRCYLTAVTRHSLLGWCPATGELMSYSADGASQRVAELDQAGPWGVYVSVASDRVTW
ncbi:hypothetical protein ACFQVD_30875 [Streptosporangium amethystogenes subsp. fukuiense]|uniref:Lipoprotein n=1 Tax=Streptosporangium amethystogenes subsp. fukuiense TaxID=698418 RepID=A0ABW2T8D0_9ACTN